VVAAVPVRTLVVARWNEDTSWTKNVEGWDVHIVQKDVDLPNRGREPSSYLWAIITEYAHVSPEDLWCFVQGDPFAHTTQLDAALRGELVCDGFVPLVGDRALGTAPLPSDATGGPYDWNIPVAEAHERWLGKPFPGTVSFWPGGQFMLTGERLLSRPLTWYLSVYTELMVTDGRLPYAAERLWPAIFGME
jgi:hypothetical protein